MKDAMTFMIFNVLFFYFVLVLSHSNWYHFHKLPLCIGAQVGDVRSASWWCQNLSHARQFSSWFSAKRSIYIKYSSIEEIEEEKQWHLTQSKFIVFLLIHLQLKSRITMNRRNVLKSFPKYPWRIAKVMELFCTKIKYSLLVDGPTTCIWIRWALIRTISNKSVKYHFYILIYTGVFIRFRDQIVWRR